MLIAEVAPRPKVPVAVPMTGRWSSKAVPVTEPPTEPEKVTSNEGVVKAAGPVKPMFPGRVQPEMVPEATVAAQFVRVYCVDATVATTEAMPAPSTWVMLRVMASFESKEYLDVPEMTGTTTVTTVEAEVKSSVPKLESENVTARV